MFNFQEELKKMPETPGVYLMYDSHDDVIYVGKAVKLKRRVSSYFRKDVKKRGPKIESMVQKISRFEYSYRFRIRGAHIRMQSYKRIQTKIQYNAYG